MCCESRELSVNTPLMTATKMVWAPIYLGSY